MTRRSTCIALLPASVLLVGCGTVTSLVEPVHVNGPKPLFGGVKHDVACIKSAANDDGDALTKMEQCKHVSKAVVCAVDLPFSLIGDVLAYPYARSWNFINSPTLAGPALQVAPPVVAVSETTQVPQTFVPQVTPSYIPQATTAPVPQATTETPPASPSK